jgi:hypothetical protein
MVQNILEGKIHEVAVDAGNDAMLVTIQQRKNKSVHVFGNDLAPYKQFDRNYLTQ